MSWGHLISDASRLLCLLRAKHMTFKYPLALFIPCSLSMADAYLSANEARSMLLFARSAKPRTAVSVNVLS